MPKKYINKTKQQNKVKPLFKDLDKECTCLQGSGQRVLLSSRDLDKECTSLQESGQRVHLSTGIWTKSAPLFRDLDKECSSLQGSGQRVHLSSGIWTKSAPLFRDLDKECTCLQGICTKCAPLYRVHLSILRAPMAERSEE